MSVAQSYRKHAALWLYFGFAFIAFVSINILHCVLGIIGKIRDQIQEFKPTTRKQLKHKEASLILSLVTEPKLLTKNVTV